MLNQINLSRVDLNLFVLFEAVLEERHVGRAAERLRLSPSAVSHGLGRLRQLLNDPLFLRTPKGVVPTPRAEELAAAIGDTLARARSVLATAEPFDPASSNRCFLLGAPDGASAVVLPRLLAKLRKAAPKVDIRMRQLLPTPRTKSFDRVWEGALADLEMRAIDIAIVPLQDVPARFIARTLYPEDFVIAVRKGHPMGRAPSAARLSSFQHLVVSQSGDAHGFVDEMLAAHGFKRRVVLTVPNFMMALAVVAETDVVAAMPRQLVAMHAARFGLTSVEPPAPLGSVPLTAVCMKAALLDDGVAWLLDLLEGIYRSKDVLRPELRRASA